MPAQCKSHCRCQCDQQGCECWDGIVFLPLPDGSTLRMPAAKATS